MEYNIVGSHPLSQRVLAIAVLGSSGLDWSAYVYHVPGLCHEDEKIIVARHGDKLSKEIATVMFPGIAKQYVWRG